MTANAVLKPLRAKSRHTQIGFGDEAVARIGQAINALLADTFALYVKTKNFHWHVSGPHFRDYHLLFDEQANELLSTTDDMAERVRKIGGTTLRSISHIGKLQRLKDSDERFVAPADMLQALMHDNNAMIASMREAYEVCVDYNDVATASLLENWIDEAEKRVWFLLEGSRVEPE